MDIKVLSTASVLTQVVNIILEAGSTVNITNILGFNTNDGGVAQSYITASGEAAGFFNVNPYDSSGDDGFDVEVLDGNDLIMTDAVTMSAWLYPEMTGSHTGNPFCDGW